MFVDIYFRGYTKYTIAAVASTYVHVGWGACAKLTAS